MSVRTLIVSEGTTPWADILESERAEISSMRSHKLTADVDIAKAYDLIIVDLEDTDREIEFCRKLRRVFKGALLLCSTQSGDRHQLAAYVAGVDEVLILPQSARVLRMRVRAWRQRIQMYSFGPGHMSSENSSWAEGILEE